MWIEFNSEIVPFDRGFVHASESLHVTESDKYMLQNMEGIELGGLHTYLISRGFVDVSL